MSLQAAGYNFPWAFRDSLGHLNRLLSTKKHRQVEANPLGPGRALFCLNKPNPAIARFWSPGHSETKAKHLIRICMWVKQIIFSRPFFFLPGPLQGEICFGGINLFGRFRHTTAPLFLTTRSL
jgi:hypothetical protein